MEYMSDSWYTRCYHTEGHCRLVVKWSTCQSVGTVCVTILRISVGWWCSGVYVTFLVLAMLPY